MKIVFIYIYNVTFFTTYIDSFGFRNDHERMVTMLKQSMTMLINKNKEEILRSERELNKIEERLDQKLTRKTTRKLENK
ncbi:FbpB family small basic protein [Alteribacter lacisalsi]|uniref:FbpB family small basic protein n=1 Tax=Alteribacter lacisalsi TaxID=2045244 RepID=UPI001F47A643|nr:FbpB family small basic protein [Alteribacter lacisalsi]